VLLQDAPLTLREFVTRDPLRLAEYLQIQLSARFHAAIRVREVVPGVGYRVYQLRDEGNRHLVDIRQVETLPPHVMTAQLRIVDLVELMVMKARSLAARRAREKGLSDRLDLHRLLNAHPVLRMADGDVAARLGGKGDVAALAAWREVVGEQLAADDPDE
jgi:hypothetical protein